MKRTTLKVISILGLAYLIYLTFFMGIFSLSEGKHLFNPYIDTQFASKYSPNKFEKITIGMSESDIVEILGKPLYKGDGYKNSLNVNYHYTGDGKLLNNDKDAWKKNYYDDFAWYQSSLEINKKGKIIAIYKGWCHD
jgi:hypothetical protein